MKPFQNHASLQRPIRIRSRRTIPRSMAYTIAEKAIRFWHLDRAQKLISSSMSRHLSTRNISSKSMHTFLSNLANRQTDKRGQTHLPPPLSEVITTKIGQSARKALDPRSRESCRVWPWPFTSWIPKVERFTPLTVDHVCQLASKSFICFQNIALISVVREERTDNLRTYCIRVPVCFYFSSFMIVLLVLSFFYSWLHSLRNNKMTNVYSQDETYSTSSDELSRN